MFRSPQIDLVVISLKLGKSILGIGESTRAIAEIENIGRDTAYGVTVNFQINEKTLFIDVIREIKNGQVRKVTFPIKGILPGRYKLKVTVDKRNLIKELKENNNMKTVNFEVKPLLNLPSIMR